MTLLADSAPEQQDVAFIDVLDPAFRFTSPEVARAREKHWYAKTPLGLLVLRYAEAKDLVRNPGLIHNGVRFMEQNGITEGPIHDWFVNGLVSRDFEDHRRLRGLVNKAFVPRMVENLRPLMRETSERLADKLASAGDIDFIEEFADQLPLVVMTELLGIPPEDFLTFRTWTSDIGLVFSLALGGDIPARVEAAVTGLYGYVDDLMAAKKADPGEDLISALVALQHAEGTASRDELQNLIVSMIFAAHDTTRLQLANAMVTFAEHPDQWKLLGDNPDLTQQAVEEVMRWRPSTNALFRYAPQDFEFRGEVIPKGTMLLIGVQAVQRDPRVFPGGDVFDITAPRSTPVLQFGGGLHYCLGAPLARMEITEALPALARRLGAPSVTGPVTWRPAIGITGPNELPLRFG
ncbi:cytochrome P450 [Streptomyces sp. NPDC058279]|uniref:cytochrome P450 n=1 Tax=Streptomyces sp. NPDC058279 TaxID=3346418 RepID=UPI0036EEB650